MNTTPTIQKEIESLRAELLDHKIFRSINKLDDLQNFLEFHVFDVWNSTFVLKVFRKELIYVLAPNTAIEEKPITQKLCDKITLDEELELGQDNAALCCLELYLQAMAECQANTTEIQHLIYLLQEGYDLKTSLKQLSIPEMVKDFLVFTFSVLATDELHKIVAVFTLSRENLIPKLFNTAIKDLNRRLPIKIDKLVHYVNRYIKLDTDIYESLAMQMIEELCANDIHKWMDCIEINKRILEKRLALLDGILETIDSHKLQSA